MVNRGAPRRYILNRSLAHFTHSGGCKSRPDPYRLMKRRVIYNSTLLHIITLGTTSALATYQQHPNREVKWNKLNLHLQRVGMLSSKKKTDHISNVRPYDIRTYTQYCNNANAIQ